MQINTLQLISGAKQAKGLAVIIDVFRAFSTLCYVLDGGADKVISVGGLEQAFQLKQKNPDYILLAERDAVKIEGADYGNSPYEIMNVDFTAKTVIHTTTNGTVGMAMATEANEIITGSFVNARAVARYIQQKQPDTLSLVCVGANGIQERDEDTLCAQYITGLLAGREVDFAGIVRHLRDYRSANKFFDPVRKRAPSQDFAMCLDLDKFDFVARAKKQSNGLVYLTKFIVN